MPVEMNFLAIIPARYPSTRFPGKPLADINGKPMIRHVWERTAAVYEHCCVATDDERILHTVERFGGVAIMTCTEHRSGTDRCAEALAAYEKRTGMTFDVVVNVQGDEPFIAEDHLTKVRECFDGEAVQIATLVKRFGADEDIFNPNSPKVVVSRDGYAIYFSRAAIPFQRSVAREDWPADYPYLKHIGLYAYRADVLREITALPPGALEQAESLEQLRWIENGYRIKVAETCVETIAVDTPEDLERVLARMR